MRKALIVTGTTLVLAPAAIVAGYFGVQKYIDWLIVGAKRPMPAIGLAPVSNVSAGAGTASVASRPPR